MPNGLQNILGGLQTLAESQRQQEIQRRQRALQGLEAISAIQPQTVEEAAQIQQAFEGGTPEDLRGLTGLFHGAAQRTRIEADQTRKDAELNRRKTRAQIEKLEAEAKKVTAAPASKKVSPNQRQAATFAERLTQSNAVFEGLERAGFNRANPITSFQAFLSPEVLKSDELKQQEQAERNFVNAVLRRESGAAIAESEFESAEKQYFPRTGDDPTTLEQKRKNRKIALAGLNAEAGPVAIGEVREQFAALQQPQPVQQPGFQPTDLIAPQAIAAPQATPAEVHPQANQALQWAQQNPNDPRAQAIMLRLGRQ